MRIGLAPDDPFWQKRNFYLELTDMSDRLQALVDLGRADWEKSHKRLPDSTEFKIGKRLDIPEQAHAGWQAIYTHETTADTLVVFARVPGSQLLGG